jgi:integrase
MSIRRDPRMLNAQGQPAFIIDHRDEYGRRKQVRTDACTLKDAQRIERDILTRIDKAKALGVPKQALSATTFEKFTDDIYLPAIKLEVKAGTYERYANIAKHLKNFFGKMSIGSIEPLTIDEYFDSRRKEVTAMGRAPGAGELRNRRFQLRAIFKRAMKKRLVKFNPVDASDSIDYTPAPKEALTRDQEERILSAAPEWLKPILILGIYSGMRRAEITSMRWEHIKDGMIYIPKENSKTGRPRSVPISSEMESALAPLAKRKLEEGSPGWVFWNAPAKSPYKANSVTLAVRRIADALSIKTTFHATRVTFVTDARESGKITDAELMAVTGHSTLRMLDHYTKIKSEHLKGRTEGLRRPKDATQAQQEAMERGEALAQPVVAQRDQA